MSPEQLFDRAAEVIGRASGLDSFTLVIPGWSRGDRAYLAGRGTPRGEVISHVGGENGEPKEQLVAFRGSDVMAWMRKTNMIPESRKSVPSKK